MKKLIDCYAKREGIHSPNDVCFFIKKTTDEHERPVLCEEQMTPSSLLLQEGDKMVAIGQVDINRTEFDIRYGSGSFFDNLGDKAIKDNFTVKFKVAAIKK